MNVSGYVNNVRRAEQETNRFTQRGTSNLQRFSGEFQTLGIAVAAAGAAMGLALRGAARESIAFESALTKSSTLIGISTEQMSQMGDAALRMAGTGRGPIELSEALFFVQSAGQRGALALDTATRSARASAIGLGETAVVADLATSAMNAYGADTLDAAQATDIMVATVREGKAEAPELAASLGRVLPIASEMGVSFDEVGASVAAMTRTGTDASTSVIQLRAILTSLLNPAQQSEEAMRELGLSSQLVRDTIREDGLWAAMQLLRTSIGDNEAALGQIIPNVRALAGFLDLTGSNAESNAQIFENMADSTGLVDEAFRVWAETTEASQQRFSAAMEAAQISLGEGLQPILKLVLDTGTGLAEMFTSLPGPMQSVVSIGAGVTAIVLGVGGAFLIAAPRIAATRLALDSLATQMPRTIAAVRGLSSLMFGPLGIALAAAGTATVLLANRKAELGRQAEDLLATLGEEADAVLDVENAFNRLSDATRRQIGERLLREHEDLLPILEETGLTLEDVVAALYGEEDAQRRVNAAVEEHTRIIQTGKEGFVSRVGLGQDLVDIMGQERDVVGEAARKQEQLNTIQEDGEESTKEITGLTGELSAEMTDLGEETDKAQEALQEYLDLQRAATDPVFALNSALSDVEEAQKEYNDAVEEYGKNSPEAEAASFRQAEALANLEQAALDSEISFDEFDRKLQQWVEQGDITKGQADSIRERVKELRGEAEDYQDTYTADIEVARDKEAARKLQGVQDSGQEVEELDPTVSVNIAGDGTVIRRVNDVKAAIDDIPGTKDISITASGRVFVNGRPAGGRVASGGEIRGLGGDEDDTAGTFALSNREWVIRAKAARKYGPKAMAAVNRGDAEIVLPGEGGPSTRIQITASADLDATDFRNANADLVGQAFRHHALSSGRVLPPGSYRVGRGTVGHGYPALDLPAPIGTPVYAVASGIVSRALRLGYSYGIHTFLQHAGGRQSRYAHLSALLVRAGQEVARGQLIGRVGSTGNSTGPHLHYEDLINGVRRSPSRLGIFDRGGVLPYGGIGLNLSGSDERVLDPRMTQLFEAINRSLSRAVLSGGGVFNQLRDNANAAGVNIENLNVQAWSDRFSWKQIQEEMRFRGVI